MRFLPLILIFVLLASCSAPPAPKGIIETLLQKRSPVVDEVMAHPETYRVQIRYTQIDRDSLNQPHFTTHTFRVDAGEYFYPASTVKFPAALMALEKLNTLSVNGLNTYTPMLTDSIESWQIPAWKDSSAQNGLPSIAHYIKKILLVSDNDAFNRLYEFMGQGPLNEGLRAKGYDLRLMHRLERALSPEQNRITNPIRFVSGEKMVYAQPQVQNETPIATSAPILLGKGEMIEGKLSPQPKDFAGKNYFPLAAQQEMLKAVLFPESVAPEQRFNLTKEDYTFLYRHMSMLPRESEWPRYDTTTYYDSYVKFLMFGDSKQRMPEHIRIFNKVGDAYGFLIDNAYIVDTGKGVEFLLAAIIYVNEDGIFNDDLYEYERIGFPFLGELGRAVYEYECIRPRAYRPDVSRLVPWKAQPGE
ncbi:MAG: hypothetical protein EAZ89_08660 [Bacteroidetes bacterium]|nr:MAG: hypothetical protein EAZ89_08660 [Bacteroidota bacterium]